MAEATTVAETPELRARAAAGDRDAFADLYREHRTTVFRFLMRRTSGNRYLAEDLTHETIVRALIRIGDYREMGRSFVAWLLIIAANLVTDHYKSKWHRQVSLTEDFRMEGLTGRAWVAEMEPEAIGRADDPFRVAMWQQAFDSLTERQRQVLVLRYIEGLNVEDTARRLGIARGAVQAASHRAYRALESSAVVRTLLEDLRDGGDGRG